MNDFDISPYGHMALRDLAPEFCGRVENPRSGLLPGVLDHNRMLGHSGQTLPNWSLKDHSPKALLICLKI